jgi:F-type H+-transporting ATPase subunit gamma
MASTQLLLRRIKTAQNVSKTTKAMQMIAASKLKKAQEEALASRPYVQKLSYVTKNLTKRLTTQSLPDYMKTSNETGKTLLIVISPDKGLCGGLITNLIREVLKMELKNYIFITVGKKAEGQISRLGPSLSASFSFGSTLPSYDIVSPIAKIIDDQFLNKKVDKVEIITTDFINAFSQKPRITQLLPIIADEENAEEKMKKATNAFQLFEPDIESILPELLQRYIEMVLFQAILESHLAEQAARMIAMQNATNSANDIIEDLRLEYNKSRQAKITNEILDITGATASQVN